MDDNKQLFAEQVHDHIEKLNELMVCASGESIDDATFQRTCLVTRLLEGSTNMLGFETWSRALGMIGKLLDHALRAGRRWDEQLSQIVSEILEAEEQVAAEIAAGEDCAEIAMAAFEGLHREAEVLLGETLSDSNIGGCSLQFEPLHVESPEPDAESPEGPSALDTLIESLAAVKKALDACVAGRDRSDRTIEDLTKTIGESEFFFAIVRDIVGHIAADHRTFMPKVTGGTVLKGVRDFFDIHARLRGWDAELDMEGDKMVLDGELARALTVILEHCIFDACSKHEARERFVLKVTVRVVNCGSFLEAHIFDNGSDFLRDTEVESYDAAAFYKGLIGVRTFLKEWNGLLWVEPDVVRGERFRFTLPCIRTANEYRILECSGFKLAVPRRIIADIETAGSEAITLHSGDRYIECGEQRVPVYRIDELADGQVDARADGDRIVILGLAEKRIGIFVDGDGTAVEGISDQLTEGGWAGLSTHQLHMGEQEYPVLDIKLVLERMDYLKQLDRVPETSGSLPMGEEVENIEEETVVPRVSF